jgi:hypothetical protein
MLRKMMLMASTGLLMLGLLAVPAQAVEPAFVMDLNGIPGVKLELCVGGSEIVHGLGFGRYDLKRSVAAGPSTVVVRSASTGDCKGTKLFAAAINLEAGKSYTIVYWKPGKAYEARLFTDDLALPAADAATLTMRHLANTGAIDVWVWQQVMQTSADPDPFPPTFNDLAKRAAMPKAPAPPLPLAVPPSAGQQTLLEAFPTAKDAGWTYEYLWTKVYAGGAYQAYLLGNARSNYRIVLIGQAGIAPTP